MSLIEQGAGQVIGAKITTDKLQKDLIDNLYKYRNEKINVKHAKKMQLLGFFVV